MRRDLKRIEELVTNVLPNIPKENFSLERWLQPGYTLPEPDTDVTKVVESGCGTVACAIGWACLYKPFSDLGLNLVFINIAYSEISIEYNQYSNWEAVAKFFNITIEEAVYLFDLESYIDEDLEGSIEDVFSRLNDFLLNGRI